MKRQHQNIESISKSIRKEFGAVVEEIEHQSKQRNEKYMKQYPMLLERIEELGINVSECYNLYLENQKTKYPNYKDPFAVLKYCEEFFNHLVQIREKQQVQMKSKKAQNEKQVQSYNQNNVYELLARRNLELMELKANIIEFENKHSLEKKRANLSQQFKEKMRKESEQLLSQYRDNFSKIAGLLKQAQDKQTQLLQANRFLKEQIQRLNLEFDLYKKNFRIKQGGKENTELLKRKLEKQYQDRIKHQIKRIQDQSKYKSISKQYEQ